MKHKSKKSIIVKLCLLAMILCICSGCGKNSSSDDEKEDIKVSTEESKKEEPLVETSKPDESGEELKDTGIFVIGDDCQFEAEITEDPDYSEESQEDNEFVALDMARLKVALFDAQVLTAKEYFILYQIIDSKYGEVSFETSDDVRFLTFEEDGRGCFWTDNEKGRPFNYEMRNEYSCVLAFDDGTKANFGFYADQGGALPGSEEGSMWLALYLEDEALWFY